MSRNEWVVVATLLTLVVGLGALLSIAVDSNRRIERMSESIEEKAGRKLLQSVTVTVTTSSGSTVPVTGYRYQGTTIPEFLRQLEQLVNETKECDL